MLIRPRTIQKFNDRRMSVLLSRRFDDPNSLPVLINQFASSTPSPLSPSHHFIRKRILNLLKRTDGIQRVPRQAECFCSSGYRPAFGKSKRFNLLATLYRLENCSANFSPKLYCQKKTLSRAFHDSPTPGFYQRYQDQAHGPLIRNNKMGIPSWMGRARFRAYP